MHTAGRESTRIGSCAGGCGAYMKTEKVLRGRLGLLMSFVFLTDSLRRHENNDSRSNLMILIRTTARNSWISQ